MKKVVNKNVIMRKAVVLFMLAIFLPGYLCAQNLDNCRFQINKTDEFTGEHILVTTAEKMNNPLSGSYQFAFSFVNIIDRDNLLPPSKLMNIKLSSVNKSLFIGKGDPVLIKLSNNDIIELLAMDDYYTETKSISSSRTLTQVSSNYEISNENLVKIMKIGIAKIQINTSTSQVNLVLRQNDNKKINKMLNCVVDI